MVGHDLSQVELGPEVRGQQEIDLADRVLERVHPAAEIQGRHPLANPPAELIGVLRASRRPGRLVAAHHGERLEAVRSRARGIEPDIVQGVLRREKRDDPGGRQLSRQVGCQVCEILLLGLPDGVVGQEDQGVLSSQPPDRMIHVDPRIHARAVGHPGARRAKLDRDERAVFAQATYDRSLAGGRTGSHGVAKRKPFVASPPLPYLHPTVYASRADD
jgi:hypothetical protein